MEWIPHPQDFSDIELGEKWAEQLELIAESIHDVWGEGRYLSGWRYGPAKDDKAKKTPNMVPYSLLPESEKLFDRRTAEQAVKIAVKLGIVKLNKPE